MDIYHLSAEFDDPDFSYAFAFTLQETWPPGNTGLPRQAEQGSESGGVSEDDQKSHETFFD